MARTMPGTMVVLRVLRTAVMVPLIDPVVSTRNMMSALRMRVEKSNERVCGPIGSMYGSVTYSDPAGGRLIGSVGLLPAALSVRSPTPSPSVSATHGSECVRIASSRSVRPSLSESRSRWLAYPSPSQSSGRAPQTSAGRADASKPT